MTKKKTQPNRTAMTDPLPVDVAYGSETFCQKCGGNVNFNGCAEKECPVVLARSKS